MLAFPKAPYSSPYDRGRQCGDFGSGGAAPEIPTPLLCEESDTFGKVEIGRLLRLEWVSLAD